MAIYKSRSILLIAFLAQLLILVSAARAQIAVDFDSSPSLPVGWQTTASDNNTGWTVVSTKSAPGSSPHSVFGQDYSFVKTVTLTTPAFVYDGSHILGFNHYYNLEDGFDGGVLEVKVGNSSFIDINQATGFFTSCPYSKVLFSGSTLAGRMAWTGTNSSFTSCLVFFPPTAAGQLVQFRWVLASDGSNGVDGWYIDDVQLAPAPDLRISELESPSPAIAGQIVTYKTTLTNPSSFAAPATITKIIPKSSSFVSATASIALATPIPTPSGNQVVVDFGTLAAGHSVTLTSVVKLNNPVGPETSLTINSPSIVAEELIGRPALFGPQIPPGGVTGKLVLVADSISPEQDGCDTLTNVSALNGNIALMILAGKCSAQAGILNVQNAGAIAAVFVGQAQDFSDLPKPLPTDSGIPAIVLSNDSAGSLFFAQLLLGSLPNVTLASTSGMIGSSGTSTSLEDGNWSNNTATTFTTVLPDADGDGVADTNDKCPLDPGKTIPGICGCGTADIDVNANGVADCFVTKDLKAQVKKALSALKKLTIAPVGKKARGRNTIIQGSLQILLNQIKQTSQSNATSIKLNNAKVNFGKLSASAINKLARALKLKRSFSADKKNASDALSKLSQVLRA
jgi:uncharacterized repeat protein (TIGR01451 family)